GSVENHELLLLTLQEVADRKTRLTPANDSYVVTLAGSLVRNHRTGTGGAVGTSSSSLASAFSSGIHSSQRGRYQFHSPSSFIPAGSSTPLIRVASINTATARPTPSCLMSSALNVAKTAKTAIITAAALVTVDAVERMPRSTAWSVGMPWSTSSLTR